MDVTLDSGDPEDVKGSDDLTAHQHGPGTRRCLWLPLFESSALSRPCPPWHFKRVDEMQVVFGINYILLEVGTVPLVLK